MKTAKKLFSFLLTIVLVLSSISISTSFAATKWPATKGIKTYVLTTKNNTKVYKSATSTDGSYGTIYATDLITINSYDSSSKRINVTYPVSSGTKKGWIPLTAVTKATWNSATGTATASSKITAYRRASTSSELGYISKGDKYYKIATSGDFTQVIYPISGGYKMGWIKTSNPVKKLKYPLKGSITVTSTSSTTNGIKCDYKASDGTKLYAPADGTAVFYQVYRKENGVNKLCSYANYIVFTSSDGTYKVKMAHLSKFNGVSTPVTASCSYPCSYKSTDTTKKLATKTVKQGDLLGYTGQLGNATGPHLHLEVYKNGSAVDPVSVFTTW